MRRVETKKCKGAFLSLMSCIFIEMNNSVIYASAWLMLSDAKYWCNEFWRFINFYCHVLVMKGSQISFYLLLHLLLLYVWVFFLSSCQEWKDNWSCWSWPWWSLWHQERLFCHLPIIHRLVFNQIIKSNNPSSSTTNICTINIIIFVLQVE